MKCDRSDSTIARRLVSIVVLLLSSPGIAITQVTVDSAATPETLADSSQQELPRDYRYQLALYVLYQIPDGVQATDYSRPGFGGGGTFIFPIGSFPDIVRADAGFDFAVLMSKTLELEDPTTGSPFDQETKQTFLRIYGGINVGGRGSALFRPYASLNLALNIHAIWTDVVVYDPFDPTVEERTTTSSKYRAVAGCDMTFGLDLNISESVALDGGFRFVKSFAVPQQLGEGSVKIFPHYFQIFLGIRAQGLVTQ